MANAVLKKSQKTKNDEFYTQYVDIQKEINAYIEYNPNVFEGKTILLPCDDPEWSNFTKFFAQNFERFGIKKLISTSYAYDSKSYNGTYQLSLFESESPKFDKTKTKTHGKIFILDKDTNKSGKIDVEDLEWDYLKGDGDFRSEEVKKLRDEADIIITNPPFSLFREFLNWIIKADKKFLIIGNKNAISYKEVFPYIMNNKIWIGHRNINSDLWLQVPEGNEYEKIVDGIKVKHIMGCWFTNLEHGRRHQPLQLMTMEDNIKYSRHKEIKDIGYKKYDNYDALDVSYVDAIPSDYKGNMGVPITFLDKYNPEQFEILGLAPERSEQPVLQKFKYINAIQHNSNGTTQKGNKVNDGPVLKFDTPPNKYPYYTAENSEGYLQVLYARIIIKYREEFGNEDYS